MTRSSSLPSRRTMSAIFSTSCRTCANPKPAGTLCVILPCLAACRSRLTRFWKPSERRGTTMENAERLNAGLNVAHSQAVFAEAQKLLPGGVNSPVRAFRAVGGEPVFINRASGPCLYDEDGNRYLDYVQSWGPMILGHAHPEVLQALAQASMRGFSFGAPTQAESELAQLVIESVPSIEMVRFVNSGTEATMSALRLARAYTGRDKIIKFSGWCYGLAEVPSAR